MRPLPRSRSLRAQAEAFTASFDRALLDPSIWIPIRLSTGTGLLLLACAAAWAPGLRDVFRLQPAVPLALLAASVGFVFVTGLLNAWGRRQPLVFMGGMLFYVVLEMTMSASFAVFAEPPGALVLVVLPVFRAALNGIGFGAPTGLAAFTAAHGIGVLIAVGLRPELDHRWLVLVSAAVSMATFLYFAGSGSRIAQGRAQVARNRAAIQAQLVLERATRLQESSETLGEALQRRHAARSALSAARLACDRLAPLVRGDAALWPCAEALCASLDDLERLVSDRRTAARRPGGAGPALDRVEVEPLARRVLEAARERWPALRAELALPAGSPGPAALLRGGAVALYQILEQLVANASEGDGVRGARRVEIAVESDAGAAAVAIRVADDGPGFRPDYLARGVAPFATTKARGAGLGLYTAERLARASGGSLRFENRPQGGAAVTVYLELAPSAADRPAEASRREPPWERPGSSTASGT